MWKEIAGTVPVEIQIQGYNRTTKVTQINNTGHGLLILSARVPLCAVRNNKTHISWKKSMCGGCRMSSAERTCATRKGKFRNPGRRKLPIKKTSTLSCLKKQSILSSRKTRLLDTSDWNTFGIFFSATRLPSRGSVTDLQIQKHFKTNLTPRCNLMDKGILSGFFLPPSL